MRIRANPLPDTSGDFPLETRPDDGQVASAPGSPEPWLSSETQGTPSSRTSGQKRDKNRHALISV
jgi:hypothetical protein